MKLFLKNEKTLFQNDDDEIKAEPSTLQKIYWEYKANLSKFQLPPVGVSFVLFQTEEEESFTVVQAFDLHGLLQTISEQRIQFQFRKHFPTKIELVELKSEPTVNDQTPMNVTFKNVPDSDKPESEHVEMGAKYRTMKT